MTYETPEIHEVGLAEDVIHGVTGQDTDNGILFPPALVLEDFDE